MLAAGGALTANAAVPSSGAKAATFAGKAICKRSTPFNNELFDNHFPLIQGSDKLPKSLTDINLNTELLAQPENLVATLYTVFMILKLVKNLSRNVEVCDSKIQYCTSAPAFHRSGSLITFY